MLFSKALLVSIHSQFNNTLSTLGPCREKIVTCLQDCKEDERAAMEFFYSTMPASDIGDYDFSLLKKFAEFGVYLAENSQWSSRIPEDIFLNYVLYYRINNEAIEDCRAFFHHALLERIKGKSMKEAALEVNVWCAEHVTYQATDERTVSPLTVLKSSYGRCGEESTLVVTAMRSVGVPARQVYTPRWAHCDDNHAWVEVWCDGEWYFLGACEPEPVLNRGWFNEAAARAMLVDSKSFLHVEGEEVITKNGHTIILNELSRYAPARSLTVTVTEGSEWLSGVTVQFELLNGSEFSSIASIVTDQAGRARITLGMGCIHIHAVKDGRFLEALVDTEETDSIVLNFSRAVLTEPDDSQEDFNFHAPKDSTRNLIQLTEEQKSLRRRIIGDADRKRKEYAKGFYEKELAEKLAAQFSCPQDVIEILKASEGNFQEIYKFLSMDFGIENKELQLQMLTSLLKKDYRDVRANVLSEHFESVLNYQNDFTRELFVPYILCPRVHYEQLAPYRKLLPSLFNEQAPALREHPEHVWKYVSQFQVAPGREHDRLISTPAGVLRSGQADAAGRKVLFTMICRTLGIPARVNPVTLAAQYYQNGEFRDVEDISREDTGIAQLTILGAEEKWSYLQNWTIAVLNEGVYQTLELTDYPFKHGKLEIALAPGSYRIITSSRTPNGNQFAKKYCFRLENGETKEVAVSLRQTEISDMLENIQFTPFYIYNEQNEAISLDSVAGGRTALLIWMEEGREPTEHILNELIESRDILNTLDCEIIFLVCDHTAFSNETFAKACKAIYTARVYYSDFSETAMTMARRMYVDPENLPLTIISRNNCGIYACGGYNVGVVGLLMKIITASNESA